MSSRSTDTSLIERLKTGPDALASQEVWQRYFARLVGLARKRLQDSPRRARDEEDVALSAFESFFRGVENKRFPRLDDRDDLWQVLVMLTERKAVDAIRREAAAKRGGGRVRGDSAFGDGDSSSHNGLNDIGDPNPTPEFAAMFTEECRRLFQLLDDSELRVVALLKMEGYSNEEIAESLDRVPRSIERKLNTIRQIWHGDCRN
jgi:DNA-directed RNA polymerase specialized sigma24 family protein